MSNQLQENLDAILLDKNTNLKPENLKQGITCLGVEGTMQAGIDTSDATATINDIASGKTAYVNGEKITGFVSDYEGPDNPFVTVSTDDSQQRLYYKTTQDVLLRPPGGGMYAEYQQIAELINLTSDKIKAGETILGVNGTLETGTDTSDATATEQDINLNKTAYVNGEKITGTLPLFPNSRTFTVDNAGVTDNTEDSILELTTINTLKQTLDSNLNMKFSAPYSDIVTAIGLTTDKLVQGNTILGVEGTYEGDNINDYIAVPANKNTIKILDCIKKIPLMDTSAVTNMDSMFYNCTSLTEIPLIDTSKVTDMDYMFYSCTSLTTIPQLDTSAVTNMGNMFRDCTSLTTIPLLNTSAVTGMSSMFNKCTSLTTIPQLDTSAVTNMNYMFDSCTSLTTIPQLDTSAVTGMSSMFRDCTSLSNDSLNNILAMLTNATAYTGTKTLKYIGLSETQATTCTTLSNWSACEAAGWTTGY